MIDPGVLRAIAESLANTAAGAQHDEFGSTRHRLYRLPSNAVGTCFSRAEDIVGSLIAAGYRVEKVDVGSEN